MNELGEVNKKIAEYENRIALLSQEIERLNVLIRNKGDEVFRLENTNNNLMQELDMYKKKNSDMEITITREWQTKVTRFTQENDELRNQLNRLSQDNDDLRRRLNELADVNKKVSEY